MGAYALFSFLGCNSSTNPSNSNPSTSPPPALMTKGQVIFQNVCSNCHGADAKGHSDTTSYPGYDAGVPPLYNSDFIKANWLRPAYILFLGAPNVRATFDSESDYIHVEEVASIRDSLILDCKNDSLPKYCDTTQYVAQPAP